MVRELPGASEVRAEMEREAAEQTGEILATPERTPESTPEPVLEMEAPQEWTDSRPPPAKRGFFGWLGSLFGGGS